MPPAEVKADIELETANSQAEPSLTEADQSTSQQQSSRVAAAGAVQESPTAVNKSSKSEKASKAALRESSQEKAAEVTLFQDSPAEPYHKPDLINKWTVLSIIFITIVMILLPFFIEDIIDYSQNVANDDSFSFYEYGANTQDKQTMKAELPEPVFEVDENLFIDKPISGESQFALDALPEKGLDGLQTNPHVELETKENLGLESNADLAGQADSLSTQLRDTAPLLVAPEPVEAGSEPNKQKQTNQAASVESSKTTPAPTEMDVVTPTIATSVAMAELESREDVTTKQSKPEQSANKISPDIESKVDAVPVVVESNEVEAEIVTPAIDEAAANEVAPVIVMADVESTSVDAAESEVVTSVSKAEFVDDAQITQQDLTTLINELITYYEIGDLSSFVGLFAADAMADGVKGIEKIRKDYLVLFDITSMRKMQIEELEWEYLQGSVSGTGEFSVTIQRKDRKRPFSQHGILNLSVIKQGDTLVIKSMSHELK